MPNTFLRSARGRCRDSAWRTFAVFAVLARQMAAPVAALAALAIAIVPAAAQVPGVTIGEATAEAGDTVSVPVDVGGLPSDRGLQGYDLTLAFDPAVLRGVAVVASEGWVTDMVAPVIDNDAGTVKVVGLATLGAAPPSCGDTCALFTLEFEAAGPGSSVIQLVAADLSDANGLRLASVDTGAVSGGAITVQGDGATPGSPAERSNTAVDSGGGTSTATWTAIAGLLAAICAAGIVVFARQRRTGRAPHLSESKE